MYQFIRLHESSWLVSMLNFNFNQENSIMKNILSQFIRTMIIAFLILNITSCEDSFLERPDLSKVTDGNFWKTADDAIQATNAIYTALQIGGCYDYGHILLGDIPGDDMTSTDVGNNFFAYDKFTVISSDININGSPGGSGGADRVGSWAGWYTGVARANFLINNIDRVPNMDPVIKSQCINEAKFLRAVCFFNIVNIWGDAPFYITDISPVDAVNISRTPKATIYEQIENDLTDAINLPEKGSIALGRATKGSAKAFLARVYLYEGKFSQAAAMAVEVINSGTYSLNQNYIDNFDNTRKNGIESVFEVQFSSTVLNSDNSVVHSLSGRITTFTAPSGTGFSLEGGFGNIIVPESSAANIYELNDNRRAVNILESGKTYYSQATAANAVFDGSTTATGLAIGKYILGNTMDASQAEASSSDMNRVIIRYAEVLLIAAEALNETGSTAQATPYLNQVRERAGLIPLSSDLNKETFSDAVMQERRVELFAEGQRFFDLVRTGRALSTLGTKGYAEPKNMVFPLPAHDLNLDKNLRQNDGY